MLSLEQLKQYAMEYQPEMNEMLLVLDKQNNQISAVKKLWKDGKLETVPPDEKAKHSLCVSTVAVTFSATCFPTSCAR